MLITGSCGPSESIPSSNLSYRYYIIYTLISIFIETLLLLASLLNRYIRSRVYTLYREVTKKKNSRFF